MMLRRRLAPIVLLAALAAASGAVSAPQGDRWDDPEADDGPPPRRAPRDRDGATDRDASSGAPQVSFRSLDGRTELTGYLFLPRGDGGRHPAVVLMHGRSGAYSSTARGEYSANTLRRRDADWARQLALRGYVALIVDSFGPRGYPRGFGAGTHGSRPAEVDEVTVRPLDAYGALAYLNTRRDVDPARVALMGWSNGGSAVLAAMATPRGAARFRTGVAYYPGCGLSGRYDAGYRPYAPVRVFIGTEDEEVSIEACRTLAQGVASLRVTTFEGATHDFDDPANRRQDNPANVRANSAARSQTFAALAMTPPRRR